MKKVYVTPSIEKIGFQCGDIITTSAATTLTSSINGKEAVSVGTVAASNVTTLPDWTE